MLTFYILTLAMLCWACYRRLRASLFLLKLAGRQTVETSYLCSNNAHLANLGLCWEMLPNHIKALWSDCTVTCCPYIQLSCLKSPCKIAKHSFSITLYLVSLGRSFLLEYETTCSIPLSSNWTKIADIP